MAAPSGKGRSIRACNEPDSPRISPSFMDVSMLLEMDLFTDSLAAFLIFLPEIICPISVLLLLPSSFRASLTREKTLKLRYNAPSNSYIKRFKASSHLKHWSGSQYAVML